MDYDPESDLKALEAMASNLTPYVYEQELYGMLAQNLPRLTVGGLLLRLHRLQGLEDELSNDQQGRLRDAALNFEQLRSEWEVHYEGKLQQELEARLRSFAVWLEEYLSDRTAGRSGYPTEATRRTIIHHLQNEAKHFGVWAEDYEEKLDRLDKRLQGTLEFGDQGFVWAEVLQPVYPQETYWWLYAFPVD